MTYEQYKQIFGESAYNDLIAFVRQKEAIQQD